MLPSFLQDSVAGIGASATKATQDYALSQSEDSPGVHSLILAISGGGSGAKPTPAVTNSPSPTANIPQSDGKPAVPFYKRPVVILIAVAAVILVATGAHKHFVK